MKFPCWVAPNKSKEQAKEYAGEGRALDPPGADLLTQPQTTRGHRQKGTQARGGPLVLAVARGRLGLTKGALVLVIMPKGTCRKHKGCTGDHSNAPSTACMYHVSVAVAHWKCCDRKSSTRMPAPFAVAPSCWRIRVSFSVWLNSYGAQWHFSPVHRLAAACAVMALASNTFSTAGSFCLCTSIWEHNAKTMGTPIPRDMNDYDRIASNKAGGTHTYSTHMPVSQRY